MYNFIYNTPTKVIFGKDSELQAGKELKSRGATVVLIHYGSERIVQSGLLDRVKKVIENEGIKTLIIGGAKPNPRLSWVIESIQDARKAGVNYILAIGGGSVIDSSKAIGYGLFNNGNVWDFFAKRRELKGTIPVGCILTNAAAGSEMSDSCVITNDYRDEKVGLSSPFGRCTFALENPALTLTCPKYSSVSGGFDMAMHTIERYFVNGSRSLLTDSLAEGLIKTVFTEIKAIIKDPQDLDARGNLMWASSLAHNGLTACGNEFSGDWACHQFSHQISAFFDTAHGASIAAVWKHWALYVYKENPEIFAQFGRQIFALKSSGDVQTDALKAINAMEEEIKSIGLPTSISELIGRKLTDEELDKLAFGCSYKNTRTIGNIKVLNQDDMRAVFAAAN